MINLSEALQIVLEKTPRPEPVEVPLLEGVGAVLVEPIASDVDLPPFDKSAMDGYAVRSEDLAHLPVELAVIEAIPAGTAPTRAVEAGTCAKIMTGAPVPAGADRVVKVEDTEALSEGRVRILRFDAGRNICVRGEDIRKGAMVLEAGHVLRPPEIGLLASVGRERVHVGRRPTVAVLATGDELVPVSAVPGPGQIRDANSSSLLACCRGAGVPAHSLGVGRDNKADLRAKIAEGLRHDVLLVSGGVSVGEWDLVPEVFNEFGVTVHFATVRMKPGKPTLFATHARGLVFGLPGNPVSTIVGFHLFVRSALKKMMGYPDPVPPAVAATLAGETKVRGNRTTFVPAILRREEDAWVVEAIETRGSADLVGFSRAEALIVLEPGVHEAGSGVQALPLQW